MGQSKHIGFGGWFILLVIAIFWDGLQAAIALTIGWVPVAGTLGVVFVSWFIDALAAINLSIGFAHFGAGPFKSDRSALRFLTTILIEAIPELDSLLPTWILYTILNIRAHNRSLKQKASELTV